ncbi:hypothetical protein PG997_007079 [Apiospora hydei]|uniref:Rhodopsin domain-containing protein n=1 Tax=Apiospora hydei TaxID=1337664 RepID=A0ABR1WQW5_9PEZI
MTIRYNDAAPSSTREVTQGRDTHTLISIWSLTGVTFIFAFARFYVRGCMAGKLRSDDYLIMLTLVGGLSGFRGSANFTNVHSFHANLQSCIVTSCGLSTKAVDYGLGRHVGTVSQEDQIAVVKWIYLASCPGVMSLAIPKLAVITLLTRLLVPGKIHQWILWSLGAAVQIFFFTAVVMFLRTLAAKCPPPPGQPDHPSQMRPRRYAASAFVDLYLAVYPSIVLYHLQMPLRQKTAFSVALGLGVLYAPISSTSDVSNMGGSSGAAAIYKTTHIPALASPDFICTSCLPSFSYSSLILLGIDANAGLLKWTVVESSSIVIASSIPVLQPLIRLLFGFSILGRPLKTWKRSYAGVVEFCGKKMATAIQRRVGGGEQPRRSVRVGGGCGS